MMRFHFARSSGGREEDAGEKCELEVPVAFVAGYGAPSVTSCDGVTDQGSENEGEKKQMDLRNIWRRNRWDRVFAKCFMFLFSSDC